ncbi:hypothetical protein F4813DRAFT_400701 [Daldinia decipiens]|uniref:uncharacterized protein n=1 Tax=Daldinia decipiens TaxID=326647 RepID=UPI0020C210EF|nr:uncharacterized protein F4813DRAFT_400701 [Daldinia decipiens]KAI1660548.1 hypothetical protein F4813DRAFT_400701 [Daldinia decipiens]
MDSAPGSRASSWANVVKNRRQNDTFCDAAHDSSSVNRKMMFKAKGDNNNKQITRPVQSEHQTTPPVHSAQSSVSAPFTFKAHYLQKVQAAKQLVNQKPDLQQQDMVLTRGVQDMTNFNAELASMRATISTLQEDLSRKNGDLIQARAALAGKDIQIEDLQNSVAMLRENIRSITVATQADEDGLAAKDELIEQLEYENAELRDSIHSGLISISEVYGPGSDQAFTRMATKQAESSGSTIMDCPNDRRPDPKGFVQAPDMQSPFYPPQALKQTGVLQGQPIHPADDSQKSEPQKDNQSSKQAYRPPKGNRPIKGMNQPNTTTRLPMSQADNFVTDVNHPITDNHRVKLDDTTKNPEGLVECVKEQKEDHPKPVNDAQEAKENGPSIDSKQSTDSICSPTQEDTDAASNTKNLSELDPSIIRLSPTSPRENKAGGIAHTITQEHLTSSVEKDEISNPSGGQHQRTEEESKGGKVDGKYRSKGIHESVDIMEGATLAKVVDEHPKPVNLPVVKQQSQVRTQMIFWKSRSPELGDNRATLSSIVSSPQINSPEPAVLPTREDGYTPESSLEDSAGWVDVTTKNKLNRNSKSKTKSKLKNSPTPAEDEKLVTEQKLTNKSTKPIPREKGIPASLQKRRGKKRPSGTIIGSNSVFSRAAKGQQSDDEAGIDESSTDSKELKICTPESSGPLSWADEVEEEEARRNS